MGTPPQDSGQVPFRPSAEHRRQLGHSDHLAESGHHHLRQPEIPAAARPRPIRTVRQLEAKAIPTLGLWARPAWLQLVS